MNLEMGLWKTKPRTITAMALKVSLKKAEPVTIRKLPSGVPGLDDIIGGGIPEFSCNMIAGAPGGGKTTLASQIAFKNATLESPALYFTVLGESSVKMLLYQQQYSFFDINKVGKEVQYINLGQQVMDHDLEAVLQEIIKQVTITKAGIVVVDSFRSVLRTVSAKANETETQSFAQRLVQFLSTWETTSFLVGEYFPDEVRHSAIFTVTDGIVWLSQEVERNSVIRKLQVMKLRGQATVPGLHTMRITSDGVQAFARTMGLIGPRNSSDKKRRLSFGIPELDRMMGGGIIEGDSILVAGPSGTGKSALATQFIEAGLQNGEPAIMAIFEEEPDGYIGRAHGFGLDLKTPQEKGCLEILYLRPLDLSVDETMQEILDAIVRVGAKRLVIDSLVGFEMALAPGFRADFRESLYRMIGALTGAGVTILSTVEVEDNFQSLQFSHYAISFLTDDIIRLRYVEIDGQLRKVLVVIKMRGGNHSKDIREYIITEKGMVIIEPRQTDYEKLSTGLPERVNGRQEVPPEPKSTP